MLSLLDVSSARSRLDCGRLPGAHKRSSPASEWQWRLKMSWIEVAELLCAHLAASAL
ncbi:hypothetical protein JOB18_047458 [Solea senegalensis]|uniref:Uncharacterized protein n=1 Tax=Solea senegalensis TaxID=28829 RepID=A0AAV6QGP1_SOLSE|nr:hypothetical protein JOB18_047458 [Solea senegalensis]